MDLDRGEDMAYSPRLTEMAIIDENASNQSIAEHFIGLLLINGMTINPKRAIMFPTEESRFEFESICSDGNIQTFEIKDANNRTICTIGINYRDIMFEFVADSELFNSAKGLFPNATDEDDYISICLNKDGINDCRSFCEVMCSLEGAPNARERFLSEVLSKISLRMVYNAHQLGKSDEEIMEALNFKIRSNPDNLQRVLNLIHDHCRDLEWETFRRELTEQGAIEYINSLTEGQEIEDFLNRRGFVVNMVSVWNAIAKNPNTPRDVLYSLSRRVRATPELLKNIVLNKNIRFEDLREIFVAANKLTDGFEREVKDEITERCMSRDDNISIAILYKFLSSITPELFDKIAENKELINRFVTSGVLSNVISRGNVTNKFLESVVNSDFMVMDLFKQIVSSPKMTKELLSLSLDRINRLSRVIERLPASNQNGIAKLKAEFITDVVGIFKNPNCDEELKTRIKTNFNERILQYKRDLKAFMKANETTPARQMHRPDVPVRAADRVLQRNQVGQAGNDRPQGQAM